MSSIAMYTWRRPARLLLFLLLTFSLLVPAFAWRGIDCPTPCCDFCVPASVHDAPGIGFDLTTSYGTAVAHLYNGTVLDLAKVPATPEYNTLMERLGNAAPSRPSRTSGQVAAMVEQTAGPAVLDFRAGLDRRSGFPSEGDYWAHVREGIAGLVRAYWEGHQLPLGMVLLGGENGTNSTFLATIRDALADLSPFKGPATPLSVGVAAVADPTFAAARGMAMYARRRQEVPGHCMEPWHCGGKREKERNGRGQGRMELR